MFDTTYISYKDISRKMVIFIKFLLKLMRTSRKGN